MKIMNLRRLTWIISLLFAAAGCGKGFLEVRPNTNVLTPTSLNDYQMMLDYFQLNSTSSLPQLSADEYYIPLERDWAALTPTERNAYVWEADVYGGQYARDDWNVPYESILYANSILDGLKEFEVGESDRNQYDYIRGQAYFVRAFSFFDLVKNFADPYDSRTADRKLGVPLKLSPNVDELVPRATMEETYRQIISDLQSAVALLPPEVSSLRNRASKPAAYALFARLYLSMREYDRAGLFADSCLALYDKLIDYNTVQLNSLTPFPVDNDECIFRARYAAGYAATLYNTSANIQISDELLQSYDEYDLRRQLYFVQNANTKLVKARRGYTGPSNYPFSGLATDEIYLIRAECAARTGNLEGARESLNHLLEKRYATGKYVRFEGGDNASVLQKVLEERRKGLVWRAGLRWDDLRRLNMEGAGITITRTIGDKTYVLEPNSPRYTFPIPDQEISMSNLEQNIR